MNRRDILASAVGFGLIACTQRDELPRVLLIGDSTVASYPLKSTPLAGWGQALTELLKDRFEVLNFAVPGNSTRRFAAEHWQTVRRNIRPSDKLLIQFGHIDARPDPKRHAPPDGLYRILLTRFVSEAQVTGAQPVLVTPLAVCVFADGLVVDTHERYPVVMREVAQATGASLSDLTQLSTELMNRVGEAQAQQWFMFAHDGVDTVHLNAEGALIFAKIVMAAHQRL